MLQKPSKLFCVVFSLALSTLIISENANADCINCTPAFSGGYFPYEDQNSWHFLIAPYLWLAGTDGNVTINGSDSDFDVSDGDFLKNLSSGFEIHLEASNGPWTVMLDPTYLKLTADDVGFFQSDITTKDTLVDGGLFYRFLQANPGNQLFTLEGLVGFRYAGSDTEVDMHELGELDANTNNIAPIIGGRARYYFNDNLNLWFRGDYGGFGVDNFSSTWELAGGLDYNFTPNFDIGIGYRALNIDVNSGDSDDNNLNATFFGPIIGLSLEF